MKQPLWIEFPEALVMHDYALTEHGGGQGLRDRAMLESALARPKNLQAYSRKRVSLAQLAAAYAFGIARNHPFVDGNKRTALIVSFAFMELNGFEIQAAPEDTYLTFLELADGKVNERNMADWLQLHAVPIERFEK